MVDMNDPLLKVIITNGRTKLSLESYPSDGITITEMGDIFRGALSGMGYHSKSITELFGDNDGPLVREAEKDNHNKAE